MNRLLTRSRARVAGLARARLGEELRTKVRTSDILQSTYLDVVRSVSEFGGDTEDEFVTWVGRVLENNIRDKRRYFAAAKRQAAEPGAGREPGWVRSPSSQAAWSEDLVLLGRALEGLAPDHRQVLLLRMVQDRSYPDVARAMGRSELAARALLHRARGALLLEIERLHARS